jgi:hypothetical protein
VPTTPTKSPQTVRELFGDLKPGSPNVDIAADGDVAEKMKEDLSIVEWTAHASALVPAVAELLDIALPGLFVSFWQKADEVAKALRESRASPEDEMQVSLYDSTTEATLDPYIEVRLNGKAPGKKIPFTVALPLTFKGLSLRIKNGEIVDVVAGECEISGSVKLKDLTLAKLRKPVTIVLAPGFVTA